MLNGADQVNDAWLFRAYMLPVKIYYCTLQYTWLLEIETILIVSIFAEL